MTSERIVLRAAEPGRPMLRWIAEAVLGDWMGLDHVHEEGPPGTVSLEAAGRAILWPDLMFGPDLAPGDVGTGALPPRGAGGEALPVLFGEGSIRAEGGDLRLGFDPLAAIAFLVSGREELWRSDLDAHGRVDAAGSLAAARGWLERPVADEIADRLAGLAEDHWPGLRTRRREGRVRVSCDVDQPFSPDIRKPRAFARVLGGDLLNRRSPALALRRAANGLAAPAGLRGLDSSDTWDRYLATLDRAGLGASFHVICGRTGGAIDGCYDLSEAPIRALMARLAAEGHEIGMHGSYRTYLDAAAISRERAALLGTLADLGLGAPHGEGNRQHYLRWDTARTPALLDGAGFAWDSSGGHADRPGFRFGTARPFRMWDHGAGRALALVQRPLVAMECSVISPAYMGLGHGEEAAELMDRLRRRSLRAGGDFTLLWHNSHLTTEADWNLFGSAMGLAA